MKFHPKHLYLAVSAFILISAVLFAQVYISNNPQMHGEMERVSEQSNKHLSPVASKGTSYSFSEAYDKIMNGPRYSLDDYEIRFDKNRNERVIYYQDNHVGSYTKNSFGVAYGKSFENAIDTPIYKEGDILYILSFDDMENNIRSLFEYNFKTKQIKEKLHYITHAFMSPDKKQVYFINRRYDNTSDCTIRRFVPRSDEFTSVSKSSCNFKYLFFQDRFGELLYITNANPESVFVWKYMKNIDGDKVTATQLSTEVFSLNIDKVAIPISSKIPISQNNIPIQIDNEISAYYFEKQWEKDTYETDVFFHQDDTETNVNFNFESKDRETQKLIDVSPTGAFSLIEHFNPMEDCIMSCYFKVALLKNNNGHIFELIQNTTSDHFLFSWHPKETHLAYSYTHPDAEYGFFRKNNIIRIIQLSENLEYETLTEFEGSDPKWIDNETLQYKKNNTLYRKKISKPDEEVIVVTNVLNIISESPDNRYIVFMANDTYSVNITDTISGNSYYLADAYHDYELGPGTGPFTPIRILGWSKNNQLLYTEESYRENPLNSITMPEGKIKSHSFPYSEHELWYSFGQFSDNYTYYTVPATDSYYFYSFPDMKTACKTDDQYKGYYVYDNTNNGNWTYQNYILLGNDLYQNNEGAYVTDVVVYDIDACEKKGNVLVTLPKRTGVINKSELPSAEEIVKVIIK